MIHILKTLNCELHVACVHKTTQVHKTIEQGSGQAQLALHKHTLIGFLKPRKSKHFQYWLKKRAFFNYAGNYGQIFLKLGKNNESYLAWPLPWKVF